jgi:hypothetical protein
MTDFGGSLSNVIFGSINADGTINNTFATTVGPTGLQKYNIARVSKGVYQFTIANPNFGYINNRPPILVEQWKPMGGCEKFGLSQIVWGPLVSLPSPPNPVGTLGYRTFSIVFVEKKKKKRIDTNFNIFIANG